MKRKTIFLDGNSLSLSDLINVVYNPSIRVEISDKAKAKILESRKFVEDAVLNKEVVYGITTGFGSFKNKTIDSDEACELQENIVRSHACGVGEPFSIEVCRAIILLRANSLAKGFSGVRIELIEKLLELLNKNVYPYIPSQGSVGSSGDLAPLCHLALVLIGEGECLSNGNRVSSNLILDGLGIQPLKLSYKEGLGLSNGTTVQTALLSLALDRAMKLADYADLIAALSVEVLMGSRMHFHRLIHEARNHSGQIDSANNLWGILEFSEIIDSHKDCDRVQDSYSLRCSPQVHGACRDSIEHVYKVVSCELNAATDNPLVFSFDSLVLSGGNFHGEPIAQAADLLKIAVSELANISERRTAKMIDVATSEGLPAYLINPDLGGLHSGMMIPQYVSAALVSENKILSHPSSVDSIPTSANQEDHVSMGTTAARLALKVVENAERVLSIELLNNTQAYDFRNSLGLSKMTGELYEIIRSEVSTVDFDRALYLDIEKIHNIMNSNKIDDLISKASFFRRCAG